MEVPPLTACPRPQAFALLRKRGVVTAIVSITRSFAVEWFANRLGVDYGMAHD
jgi:phosphoserine phosphatase